MSLDAAAAPMRQEDVKRHNASLALRALRDTPGLTRAKLSKQFGVTKVGIARHIDELLALGLVTEHLDRQPRRGRPGWRLRLATEPFYALGYDLRMDRQSELTVDTAGRPLHRRPLSLSVHATLDDAVELVARSVRESRARQAGELVGVAVSLPGHFEQGWTTVTRSVYSSPGAYPILERVRQALGADVPVVMTDIPSAAAAAHSRACGVQALFQISVGVGAGLGQSVDPQARYVDRPETIEIGHMPFVLDGPACTCGRRGCADTMVGFRHLAEAVRRAGLDLGDDPAEDIQAASAVIAAACDRQDSGVVDAVVESARWMALLAGQVITLCRPGALTLGGYPLALGHHFEVPFRAELATRVAAGDGIYRTTELGDDASAQGAALFALEPLFDDPLAVAALVGSGSLRA